jgi:hypothetical protein
LADLDEGRAQRLEVLHELFGRPFGGERVRIGLGGVDVEASEHARAAVFQQEPDDPGGAG